eukprot:10161752-Ditylum_brightwellii.AAC.1
MINKIAVAVSCPTDPSADTVSGGPRPATGDTKRPQTTATSDKKQNRDKKSSDRTSDETKALSSTYKITTTLVSKIQQRKSYMDNIVSLQNAYI